MKWEPKPFLIIIIVKMLKGCIIFGKCLKKLGQLKCR